MKIPLPRAPIRWLDRYADWAWRPCCGLRVWNYELHHRDWVTALGLVSVAVVYTWWYDAGWLGFVYALTIGVAAFVMYELWMGMKQ